MGYQTEIRGAILAHRTHLKSGVRVYEGAVLGEELYSRVESRDQAGGPDLAGKIFGEWFGPQLQSGLGEPLGDKPLWTPGRRQDSESGVYPEFAAKLGVAYGTILPESSWVVLGTDHYPPGQKLKAALVSGLLGSGVNLYDLGVAATPVTRQAVVAMEAVGGIQLRVSPVAPENILVEFFDAQGLLINREMERKVEQAFFAEEFRRAALDRLGQIRKVKDFSARYLENILKATAREEIRAARYKAVVGVDPVDGPLDSLLTTVLTALGCATVAFEADAACSYRTVADVRKACLPSLAEQVRRERADFWCSARK